MQDPLSINIPLAGVETELPQLPNADYPLQCTDSKIEMNSRQDGYNWNLEFTVQQNVTAIDGRQIVAGKFKLFKPVPLQPAPDSKDPEGYTRLIAEAVDALFGTDKSARPAFSAEVVEGAKGKLCVGTTKNEEYQGRTSTKLARLKKLPA